MFGGRFLCAICVIPPEHHQILQAAVPNVPWVIPHSLPGAHVLHRPPLLLLPLLQLVLTGCPVTDTVDTGTEPDRGELVGMSITPFSPTLAQGDTLTFEARGFYENETSALLDGVSWISEDSRVLRMDSSIGTAVAVGETSVIATLGELSARTATTVRNAEDPPTSVAATPSALNLAIGDSADIQVIATYADTTTGQIGGSCQWSSSDAAIATVQAGHVQAIRSGTADISATCPERSPAAVSVTVAPEGGLVLQSDIQITFFDATVSGTDVTYDIVVTNGGAGNAGSFWLDLFADQSTPPTTDDSLDGLSWIPGLAEGTSLPISLTLTDMPATTLMSWVSVDLDNRVSETNETNNINGPLTVVVSSQRPELSITSVDALSDGESTLYEVALTNTGSAAAEGFWVDLFLDAPDDPVVDDLGDDFQFQETLAPGETRELFFEVDDGPVTTWSSVLFADTNNQVDESNESNNLSRVTVTVE
ncbi:MAG: hypothetical protein ACJAZO_004922 [Myxococcota bacterium]